MNGVTRLDLGLSLRCLRETGYGQAIRILLGLGEEGVPGPRNHAQVRHLRLRDTEKGHSAAAG